MKLFLQKKRIQLALFLALAWVWGAAIYQITQEQKQEKIEKIEKANDLKWYPFEHRHLPFRDDNKDFFTDNLQLKKETIAPGVNIIRDAWLMFYVVQKEDIEVKDTTYTSKDIKVKEWKKTITKKIRVPKITITHKWNFEKIRNKLSAIPEFSYLKSSEYDRSKSGNKTKSFNIPRESVKAGMYIPIPMDHRVREVSPQDFANYCYDAIEEMGTSNNNYSKDIKQLLAHTPKRELIVSMLAFARSETAEEYTNFIQPLGDVELNRREPWFKAFSFTYFHILMEKNSDKKTAGPWLKARLKLGLTEGQCYHPKNAAKLFLAYWIEKTNGHLNNILPLTPSNLKTVWTKYNWSPTYAEKLEPNFIYAKKLVHWEIINYDNKNLEQAWFTYRWLNSRYQHIYKLKTPKSITSNDALKKFAIEQFNRNKSTKCPTISEDNIFSQSRKHVNGNIIPDTICIFVSSK